MRRMFVEVEIAEKCYPIEAALWIALGRVPEFQFDGHGFDARGSLESEANGYTVEDLRYFLPPEFELHGVELEFQRYIDAVLDFPGHRSVDEANAEISSRRAWLASSGNPDPLVGERVWPSLGTEEIAELRWVETKEAKLKFAVERSKLDIQAALMDGKLVFTGVCVDREFDLESTDYTDMPEPQEFQPNLVGFAGIDWKNHVVLGDSCKYLLATIPTQQLFELFPLPVSAGPLANAIVSGGTIIVESDAERREPINSLRNRPTNPRKDISKAVFNEFKRRKRKGHLAEKRESVYAEAIEWCSEVLGENIPRSTMQRYLSKLFEP
ncbi:hypothetical protein [Pseudosulfitobacter sp. DSM 107133]|uniref:hypothetical protein n=1 Tax=Pseudosulfitobacter sp. DSM 107133 TaxID=2883100 RepID=UPI0013B42667|nr:hypothetical protein [Pseudosulfitobacter sp. DSM 107133]UOA27877.1 hypothetical protein DSM107133_02616 [Pseudosulfitobacter sp. DSM 107133]